MHITLNGKAYELPAPATVAGLLAALQVKTGQVAVEKNRVIVARSTYADEPLNEGDEIELVQFIGGG